MFDLWLQELILSQRCRVNDETMLIWYYCRKAHVGEWEAWKNWGWSWDVMQRFYKG